jgi:hypothetical protein
MAFPLSTHLEQLDPPGLRHIADFGEFALSFALVAFFAVDY